MDLMQMQIITISLGESTINLSLIFSGIVIGVIQAVKEALKLKKINISNNVWKVIVLLTGFIITTLQFGIDGMYADFNIFLYITTSFLYAAISSLLYQSGKLSLNKLLKIEKKDESSN